MRTGIVIITYNIDTRIFLLQIGAIRKFCKDDFTIEVIDNSTDNRQAEAIKYHSDLYNISYKKSTATTKDSSGSHSFAANLAYHMFKDCYDILFFLDHDCIPVAPFSCDEILGDKLMAGVAQKKSKKYFWPGCFMFRKVEDVDFSFNRELQLDTGGNLYQLIEKYGEDACVFFTEEYRQMKDADLHYFAVINSIFWHCIAASNWNGLKDNDKRVNAFVNEVGEIVDS